MKLKLLILLMFPMFAFAQITPQFRDAGSGNMRYTWTGKSPAGYDTLWNAQTLRTYINSHSILYTGSNGITKVGNDFQLGGNLSSSIQINTGAINNLFIGDYDSFTTFIQINPIYGTVSASAFDPFAGGSRSGINLNNLTGVSISATNNDNQQSYILLDTLGIHVQEPYFRGIKYNWDDDSNLGDSSLVPKRYVNHYVDSVSTGSSASKVDTATYDVFLIGGQSNAQGHGDSTLSTTIVPGTALMYYNGKILPLKDPVGNAIYGSAWPAFALRYYKLTGHKLLFVPRAKGGSAMCFQSDGGNGRWSGSGLLRYQARDTLNAALVKMATQGLKVGKISGLWAQGEQEGVAIVGGTETITQYRDTTANTFAFFRNYWPRMQWGIIRTGKSIGFDFYSGPRSGQEQLVLTDSLTQIISRSTYDFYENAMLLPDDLHYNQKGLNFLGDEAAQQFVAGFKYSNVYTIFSKTGVNVTTPLAFLDVASGTTTTPGLVLRKGVISSTIVKGALMATGLDLIYTDSTSTNRMLAKYTTASGITANNIPYASTNSNLTSDTTLQYTGTKLSIGVQAGTYSASSRVDIKGTGNTNTTAALNIYNSSNTLMYRFLNNQQFIIQAGGTFNVGSGSGGVAMALFHSPTAANTDYISVFRNSSSVQALALRADTRVEFNGNQQVRLPTIAGDPGSTAARDIWYNSTLGQFRVNRASTVFNLAVNPMTTAGDIVIGGTSGLETRLADIATGNVLKAGGVGVAPAYGKVTSADIDATVAPIASPTFTGTPTLPTGTIAVTQSAGNSTTAVATTAFVTTADNLKANIASPTFTGVPAAPTAAPGTNTTQLATTAFVQAANSSNVTLTGAQTISGVKTFTFGFNISSANPIGFLGSNAINAVNLIADDSGSTSYNVSLPAMTSQVSVAVTNSTTVVLSAATLNSTYPNSKPGTMIICPSIIAGAVIYIKAAGTTWQTVASTITP